MHKNKSQIKNIRIGKKHKNTKGNIIVIKGKTAFYTTASSIITSAVAGQFAILND